jgi:hypothetical protein
VIILSYFYDLFILKRFIVDFFITPLAIVFNAPFGLSQLLWWNCALAPQIGPVLDVTPSCSMGTVWTCDPFEEFLFNLSNT